MQSKSVFAGVVVAVLAAGVSAEAAFDIPTSTGLFTPSFRGQANSTYFAWEQGSFDGNDDPGPDVVNPVPSVNPANLAGATLTQLSGDDIISGSDNIYFWSGTAKLSLAVPTDGVAGTGFTTLIVQGLTLSNPNYLGFLSTPPVFDSVTVGGDSYAPELVIGAVPGSSTVQWWAKFEIPGNASSYDVSFSMSPGGHTTPASVSGLSVDVLWSEIGFAADTAAVPEPLGMGALGVGALVMLRRRRAAALA